MDADVKRKQLAAALNRAAQGDRAALRLIYDMTSAKLFGVCLRILNDRSEAEDVLQEVYLTVWNKGSAFDEARASPITWLVAIARNRAIDRARSGAFARRSEPIEAAADVADPGVSAFEFLASASSRSGSSPVSMRSKSANPWRSRLPSWAASPMTSSPSDPACRSAR
jgi:RNA polymerase sigma-70 factor (ECF subfamily)